MRQKAAASQAWEAHESAPISPRMTAEPDVAGCTGRRGSLAKVLDGTAVRNG